MFRESLVERALRNELRIKKKVSKALTKNFKKALKSAIKQGQMIATVSIDGTHIYGIPSDWYIEIYEEAIKTLNLKYKNSIVFDIEHHGYMSSHKRLRGRINK